MYKSLFKSFEFDDCANDVTDSANRNIDSTVLYNPNFFVFSLNTFFHYRAMSSSIGSAIKQAFSSVTDSAKIKDLQSDMVQASESSELTTDHGVKVSDTDNWSAETFQCLGLVLITMFAG